MFFVCHLGVSRQKLYLMKHKLDDTILTPSLSWYYLIQFLGCSYSLIQNCVRFLWKWAEKWFVKKICVTSPLISTTLKRVNFSPFYVVQGPISSPPNVHFVLTSQQWRKPIVQYVVQNSRQNSVLAWLSLRSLAILNCESQKPAPSCKYAEKYDILWSICQCA